MLRKVNDTFNDGLSNADLYFDVAEQKRFYRLFRKNTVLPKNFATIGNNSELTTKEFSLRGVQFGNWLSTEDKFDYLSVFYVSMLDLNKILGFKNNNMGLDGNLGICFGSRGAPRASAHFSQQEMIINLSRYWDSDRFPFPTSKMARFRHTGGAGSLAHEYGHFLDAIIGARLDQSPDFWLTGPHRSINWKLPMPDKRKNPMSYQMRVILDKALIDPKKPGGFTKFGERLRKIKRNREYYCRNLEIWARIFEQYICYRLKQRNIENLFLTSSAKSYGEIGVYLDWKDFPPIAKEIDKLILMFRKEINK